jgi:hypothetical protein
MHTTTFLPCSELRVYFPTVGDYHGVLSDLANLCQILAALTGATWFLLKKIKLQSTRLETALFWRILPLQKKI